MILQRVRRYIPPLNIIVTVLCAGFCYFLNDGISFAFGIIYSDLKDVFPNSAATTAVLPAMVDAVPQFSAIVTCPFVQAAGSGLSAVIGGIMVSLGFFVSGFVSSMLPLYFTIGIFSGVGLELVYVAALGAVATATSTNRGLAFGITICFSSLGTVFFTYILPLMINQYFWAGTFILVGGMFLNIIIVAVLFYYHFDLEQDKEEATQINSPSERICESFEDTSEVELIDPDSASRFSGCRIFWRKFVSEFSRSIKLVFSLHLWANVGFLMFMINEFIHGMTMVIPENLMYDQLVSSGFTDMEASTVSAVFSGLSTVGHLVWGIIGDKFSPINTYCFAQLGTAISIIFIPYIKNYAGLVSLVAVSGFFRGYNETLYSMVIIQDLGVEYFYAGLVVLLTVTGAGNMIGTPLGGYIYDKTNSYQIAFVSAGCILIGASVILFCVRHCVDILKRMIRKGQTSAAMPS